MKMENENRHMSPLKKVKNWYSVLQNYFVPMLRFRRKIFTLFCILSLSSFLAGKTLAQIAITGPTEVCPGAIVTYAVPFDPCYMVTEWGVPAGFAEIIGPNDELEVVVIWTEAIPVVEICVTLFNTCTSTPEEVCLLVEVAEIPPTSIFIDICQGECVEEAGELFCDPGTYQVNLASYLGCDSTVFVTINVTDPPFVDLGDLVLSCDGPLVICNQTFVTPGLVTVPCFGLGVCDTIFVANLIEGSVIADAGPPPPLGCNNVVILEGGGSSNGPNITYRWEVSVDGEIINSGNTPNPLVLASGAYYYLTVTNEETGCKATDSVFVDDVLFFEVDIEGSTINCAEEIDLTAVYDDQLFTGSFHVNWTTTDGNIVSGSEELTATIDGPGNYCVSMHFSQIDCEGEVCYEVELSGSGGNVVAEAGPDKMVDCTGAGIELDGTGSTAGPNIIYEWTAQNCCIINGSNTLNPTVNHQGWYYLTVTDVSTGCFETDSVYVGGLEIEIDSADFLCQINNFSLNAEVSGANIGFSSFWSTPDGIIVSGNGTLNPVIGAPGTYCLDVISLGQFCPVQECIDVGLDTSDCSFIEGVVLLDENNNCQTDLGEMPLTGWLISAEGANGTFFGTTNTNGFYSIPVPPGDYTAVLTAASGAYSICDNDVSVSLPTSISVQVVDFSVNDELSCPVLTVDIANNTLRRCADNNFFYVNYCNEGTETAEDAYIEITLDPDLSLVFSPANYTQISGQLYSFEVGDIAPDECGEFWFQVFLDCDVEIAETHCTEAHIFPDENCFQPNPLWSGASLEVRASCTDSTRFTITNVGTVPLTVPAGFLVIEDAVMYRPGETKLLAPDESMIISLPANGSTWRLELEQEPFHPLPNVPVAWIEGCGENGMGTFSTGFVNQRYLGDPELYKDTDCTQNQAPFDPNDKQGFPLGYAEQNYIQQENQIEYLIRFQNTGNDTAFQVVLIDTIDEKLDLTTFRPGAASHAYEFEILGTGTLKFTFPNANLPDSTTNAIGSQGFVQFVIAPKQDILPGQVIYNDVDIYFDTNDPIRTNETYHTIEKPKLYAQQHFALCAGELFQGLEIMNDTMLIDTFPEVLFDSILFSFIQVLPAYEAMVSTSICAGESYVFDGQILTETGTYQAGLTASNGCDSSVILNLNFYENYLTQIEMQICAGDEIDFFGVLLSESGTYQQMLAAENGCDSLIELQLQVKDVYETTQMATICEGSFYDFYGQMLAEEGEYEASVSATNGCDSIVRLALSVIENASVTIQESICEGTTYSFGGQVLTIAGAYQETFTSVMGCDSVVQLTLEVFESVSENFSATVCPGEGYELGGQIFYEPGLYEWGLPAANGCDSTITLTLDHWPTYENERFESICFGDTVLFNGTAYVGEGTYPVELTSVNGCDSVEILQLNVQDSLGSNLFEEICANDTLEFNGQLLTETGVYETIYSSVGGCDSTVVLDLEVRPVFLDTLEEYVLFGEIYNGEAIFSDTVFTEVFLDEYNCEGLRTTYVFAILSTGENLADEISFSVFPNPTEDRFYVKFDLPETTNAAIEVFDIFGQKVVAASRRAQFSAGENSIEIVAAQWASGIYLVQMQMGSGIASSKILVK